MFNGAFPDLTVVDRATAAFTAMIAAAGGRRRHGGRPLRRSRGPTTGSGARWTSSPLRDPELFVDYYANDVLALVAQAWLGPGYQVTSQVNVVNPGGAAQVAAPRLPPRLHVRRRRRRGYPAHVHRLSPALTLQGAVAHCDMPVETGPTLYLPYSQHVRRRATSRSTGPRFTAYFAEHHVQLPLREGDAVFFNPALFHGAGANRSTDVRRMANLLQVSSAFGRAMETVDRAAVVAAVYPALRRRTCRRGGRARPAATSSPLRPRATPSRPTSTATSRWTAWRRRARQTCSGAPWSRTGRRPSCCAG